MDGQEKTKENNIRELRRDRKMSMRDLCSLVKCSESHMYNVEMGKENCSMKLKIAIANALDVPLETLFSAKDTNADAGRNDIEPDEFMWVRNMDSERTYQILKTLLAMKKYMRDGQKHKTQNYYLNEEINYGDAGITMEALRKRKNISRAQMANKLQISEGTYKNMENNNGIASAQTFMEAAAELGVYVDALFSESLKNKTLASKELIKDLMDDADNREKMIFQEAFEALFVIMHRHGE